MASKNVTHTLNDGDGGDDSTIRSKYRWCLVKPMGRDGDPPIRGEHIIDATLVSGIVFFAVILGDVLISLSTGTAAYLTTADIIERIPTAVIAFGLTFFFQAARARGIDVLEKARRILE